MSTEIAVIPDRAPDYALALLAQYGLKPLNDLAIAGIGAGMPPSINCKGTRFQLNYSGESILLKSLEIGVVIVAAKDAMTKRFYAGAYNPDAEATAPDCYSINGTSPSQDSKLKQCETCASCPQNQFGSGKDAAGNPGKGKACGDRKVLAIYVASGKPELPEVWQFEITPAALKNFGTYVRQQLSPRGLDLRTVVTTIGFDESASFPQYTFTFGGMVPNEMLGKVLGTIASPEVKAIVEPSGSGVVQQVAHQEVAQGQPDNSAAIAAEQARVAAEKAEADKKAAAAEKKRLADEKKAADKAAADAAKNAGGVELGGFGGGFGEVAGSPAADTTGMSTSGTPTDTALASALGLDL
jgi:hypothetical protein